MKTENKTQYKRPFNLEQKTKITSTQLQHILVRPDYNTCRGKFQSSSELTIGQMVNYTEIILNGSIQSRMLKQYEPKMFTQQASATRQSKLIYINNEQEIGERPSYLIFLSR